MRSRAHISEHEAAVARRLELLSAELAAVRGDLPVPATRPRAVGGAGELEDGDESPAWSGPAAWLPRDYTHIRAVPDLELGLLPAPQLRDPTPEEPTSVPAAGRHAARRFGHAWTGRLADSVADALPETVRGRVGLGAGQVAVIAVLVALGLAATCWWLVRGDSRPVAAPTVVSGPGAGVASDPASDPAGDPETAPVQPVAVGTDGAALTTSGASEGAEASAASQVVVDVSGKVRRPGIAVLDAGSRVVDAIKAAGGARPGVDLGALNLARLLTDGEQIVVGGPAPVGVAATTLPPGGTAVGALVNLNTADETTLETLPEVGPVTAQSILTWRTQNHGFTSVDELLEVDGIGDATLAKLTPYVTL